MTPSQAAALTEIARRVRRLPLATHRDPRTLFEQRDDLAAEILRIVRGESTPVHRAVRITRVLTFANGRAVPVERRRFRAGFGL